MSLLATAIVARFIAETTAELERLHFEDATSAIVRAVAERMQTYDVALDAGVALFGASRSEPDAETFGRFVRWFGVEQDHPGIQGYGYTPAITAEGRAALEARLHAEGYPGFHVWPEGEREVYQPVMYIFPQDRRNRAALGYDMMSESTRAEAMRRARDSGELRMTGPVVLVQEIDEDVQTGILMYAPVYRPGMPTDTVEQRRAALQGFVYAPFRVEDLFQAIFAHQPSSYAAYRVYDGEPVSGNLLYQSADWNDTPDQDHLHGVRTLDVGGRTWTLVMRPTDRFLTASVDTLLVPLAMGIGVLVSFALFFVVLRETRSRSQAVTVALELQRSEERLRDANRAKDEFLAMLGHELRNPLAATRSAIEVLRLSDLQDPDALDAVAAAERQMLRQKHLVDDLLDVSRVSRGKIVLRRSDLDLRSVVAEAAETVRSSALDKQQNLEVVSPDHVVPVNGDPTRLAQVVQNLLTNAIKYTPKGGTVSTTVALEDGRGVVRVRDTGIGIEPRSLERIFDLFAQVDTSLARSTGGLGIGLTLSRRLVELHGGTIQARSDGPGCGSEFVVRLPVAERSTPQTKPSAQLRREPVPGGPSLRVLVIEDNDDARLLSERLLRKWGHQVWSAEDGERGLRVALEERPDVALVDIGLPNMDGFEVAKRIRSEVPLEQMVLVAVSGYGRDEDRRKSAEAGFDRHLTKPVEPPELRRILRDAGGGLRS